MRGWKAWWRWLKSGAIPLQLAAFRWTLMSNGGHWFRDGEVGVDGVDFWMSTWWCAVGPEELTMLRHRRGVAGAAVDGE